MANTSNFGFKKFPPGAITDDGHQFSAKDRDTLDALLYSLFQHDHSDASTAALAGPAPYVFPDLTLGTAGALAAGRTYYYKFSYVDENGNETEASAPGAVTTPVALSPPTGTSYEVSTTGGTLTAGTYRYALSYYQDTSQTPAPEVLTVVVPAGTSTNTVTLTLAVAPDEATGWKIYRRAPDQAEYGLLATVVASATEYVDDGGDVVDTSKRRPTINTTNGSNSVTVALPASELPLDTRVDKWRIYRAEGLGNFGPSSLVATVTETTTQGGADLITSYEDVGQVLGAGTPLSQTAIPPVIPQLDGTAFGSTDGRLPVSLAPAGIFQHHTWINGTLAALDYHQFVPLHDMVVQKLEAFFLTAPTGVDGSNYLTIKVSDDETADEVQRIWVVTEPRNEVQRVVKSLEANTWTLTYSGQTTAAIPALPTPAQIRTALEDLTNIAEVFVTQVTSLSWDVQFSDPGGQDVAQMTGTVSGGTITVTTLIEGSDGGTFTVSDGVSTTSAIAFGAVAATLATRLETDLTTIVDVTVTGAGTAADPWLITWVNPGDTAVPLLQLNDAGLSGTGYVERVTRGHGATSAELVVDTTAAYHSWEASVSLSDSQEAEDAPAVSSGADVSDAAADNGVATELTGSDTVEWEVGVLAAGTYVARFYVAPVVATVTRLTVYNDSATPTVNATLDISQAHPHYNGYEVEFVSDGVVPVMFEVDLITGTSVRVDRFEWELVPPTLHAGAVCTVEVLVTGSPTTNGSNAQFSIWY